VIAVRVGRARRTAAAPTTALTFLLLPLLLSVLGACGGRDNPAPDTLTGPPPAAGYTRVIGTGFTIDMPASWQQPSLDPAAFEQTAAALRAQNPELAAALDQTRANMGTGGRLFAIDPADGSSVNLIVTSARDRSLDSLVAEAVKQLQAVGVASLREERTNVGPHPATRIEFSLPVKGKTGTVSVPETQYYVLRSKKLFILTLFGGSPSLATVADSLRIA
jgi:hypothetical protein